MLLFIAGDGTPDTRRVPTLTFDWATSLVGAGGERSGLKGRMRENGQEREIGGNVRIRKRKAGGEVNIRKVKMQEERKHVNKQVR